jgi:hypothetical protein
MPSTIANPAAADCQPPWRRSVAADPSRVRAPKSESSLNARRATVSVLRLAIR